MMTGDCDADSAAFDIDKTMGPVDWAAAALDIINAKLYKPEIVAVVDEELDTAGTKVVGRTDSFGFGDMEVLMAADGTFAVGVRADIFKLINILLGWEISKVPGVDGLRILLEGVVRCRSRFTYVPSRLPYWQRC